MPRRIPHDWHPGSIPDNVEIHPRALIETALCFEGFRSELAVGLTVEEGAALYTGTMLDVGPHGLVRIGRCCMLNNLLIRCDELVEIGDYALLSWNVVIMDSYRTDFDLEARRMALRNAASRSDRRLGEAAPTRPVRLGRNVWVGFDTCILPGVTIGEGAIVGARSVVCTDIPPMTIAGGNPARVIRAIEEGDDA
ncbi:MAG TPA: acyltransferase [Phycisphaerales bacterium]|nr:acyltransferase [Phycisphaerales bacterium]